MKTRGKIIIGVLVIAAAIGLKWLVFDSGHVLTKTNEKSVAINQILLPTAPANAASTAPEAPLPSSDAFTGGSTTFRIETWAWNAQMGALLANGGSKTTKGSLVAAQGVQVNFTRQDDGSIMQQDMATFAAAYDGGDKNTQAGTEGVVIMGDGSGPWLHDINLKLAKIGDTARIYASLGKSDGEDKFMAPPSVALNKENAKGLVCACVIRDGDWNVVVNWASINGIKINWDESTYDPDAINFVNASSYIDAVQKYIAGYHEIRPKVRDGLKIGTQDCAVNSIATWTPGDVMEATQKGGLVSILSTRENTAQMAATLIMPSRFVRDNKAAAEKMLTAFFLGADQVKSYTAQLNKAGDISASYYNEGGKNGSTTVTSSDPSDNPANGSYWVKYYNGVTQTDKSGVQVELGGSKVDNLADNLTYFGIAPGSSNTFAAVYTTFADIDKKYYPKIVPDYPAANQIFDPSLLRDILAQQGNDITKIANATAVSYTSASVGTMKGQKSYYIQFETGKWNLLPAAVAQLEQIKSQCQISAGMKLKLVGYTDNTGDQSSNQTLSQQRANAVYQWLQQQAPNDFTSSRVTVDGQGQNNPIGDNTTSDGRAKNRRVDVELITNQ